MIFAMEDRPRDDGRLFDDHEIESHGVFISARARLQTCDGYRVVSACGVVLAHYALGDRMGEAHAMVSLVEQGRAYQKEVARAFGCSERTVRRHQRRFECGGLSALGRSGGYPKGRPRLPASRLQIVGEWKAKGLGNREIARRLGVSENAVRKVLRRLGWKREEPEQLDILFEAAHPNLSAPGCPASAGAPSEPPEPPVEAREDSSEAVRTQTCPVRASGTKRRASPSTPIQATVKSTGCWRAWDC
jgi:DNA-binding CsgD family transcriptional regulator